MRGENFVAVYHTSESAERARDRLRREGIEDGDMRVSAEGAATTAQPSGRATTATGASAADNPLSPRREEGFLDWLFGSDEHVPERDRSWYGTNLREGRTALSVHVSGRVDAARIIDILEEFDPIDIDDESWHGRSASAGISTAAATSSAGERRPETASGDQVIPIIKEELDVGKRQTEQRYRVRSYAVERPVEQQVELRDEKVVIERRPVVGDRQDVTRGVGLKGAGIEERDVEIVERHEEPVVAKTARATEEVVVHKETRDRTETVRDTVRETEVDIGDGNKSARQSGTAEADRAAAGDKPGARAAGPAGAGSLGEKLNAAGRDGPDR